MTPQPTGTFEDWWESQAGNRPISAAIKSLAEAAYHAGAAGMAEKLQPWLHHDQWCFTETHHPDGKTTRDGCICGLDTALAPRPPTR